MCLWAGINSMEEVLCIHGSRIIINIIMHMATYAMPNMIKIFPRAPTQEVRQITYVYKKLPYVHTKGMKVLILVLHVVSVKIGQY